MKGELPPLDGREATQHHSPMSEAEIGSKEWREPWWNSPSWKRRDVGTIGISDDVPETLYICV